MSPRKSRRRWNRATVGSCVLGVVAFHVLIAVVVELLFPVLRDSMFVHKSEQLNERRAQMPGRPLLLALGSSRMLMGLDAARITVADKQWLAFNFGELRAGPILEQVFLRRLLANGVRPDALLIELAPLQFANNIGLSSETSGTPVGRFNWSEMNRLAGYYDSPMLARGRWLKSRTILSDSNQQELHDALHIDAPLSNGFTSSADAFGFAPYPVPTPEARAAGIRSHVDRYAPRLVDAHLAAGPARSACDLAALCRREHLPFTVVLMPEVSALRQLCTPSFSAEVEGMFADMHREADFEMIDARAWIDDNGFWDGHHLHVEGAKQFSDRLAAEVLPKLKRLALK